MNKLGFFIAIMPFCLFFQACERHNNDSIARADSINAIKDTAQKLTIIVERGDAEFAVRAASAAMAKIELGELARQKAINRRIKNFGTIMVTVHTKINDKIKALALGKKIVLPLTPGAIERKEIVALAKKTGRDFDKAYLDEIKAAYKKDIKDYEAAVKNCADPDIKSFAAKTLPVFRAHLDALAAISDSIN